MQKAFINGKIIDGTKDMSVMSGKCITIANDIPVVPGNDVGCRLYYRKIRI